MFRVGAFQTTKWSLVLAARERDDPAGRDALAELCRAYWYPLYAFVRRRTGEAERARDLTQGFFAEILERDALRRVDPDVGRFRAFLLASVKHYISNERERERALKRGGGRAPISLDADEAEERYRIEPKDDRTPELAFERNWAATVLDRAARRLEAEFAQAGKLDDFKVLSPFLTGAGEGVPYKQVAETLGTTEAAVKMAVRRLRQRYGAVLRDVIAQTVNAVDQVDRELRHLLEIVAAP